MGLLDAFKQYVGEALPGGLLNPELAAYRQWRDANAERTRQTFSDMAKGKLTPEAIEQTMDLVTPMGLLGHTVWHGSPHRWVPLEPSIAKVGTGEGAQAYGHGFYSAESPEIAKWYKDKLGKYPKDYNKAIREADRVAQLRNYGIDKPPRDLGDDTLNDIVKNALADRRFHGVGDSSAVYNEFMEKYLPKGHLYKLDIPDEDISKYLDWDKPLGEQSEYVKNVFAKNRDAINKLLEEDIGNPNKYLDVTGKERYQALSYQLGADRAKDTYRQGYTKGAPEASVYLNQLGIPGIRYLDAVSRGPAQGTYNYVTFDPSRIKVLELDGTLIK